jgi:HAD superfamily hydrolase (TIGR01509 family)
MVRAILFDFNGVIVNDEPQHCDALIAALETYGYTLGRPEYYRHYLGFDDRECFRFTFERMGRRADDALLQEAIGRKAELYERAIRSSLELVPGSADFVRQAAGAGYRLAVVSGALRREIEMILSAADLRDHFEVIVAAEDVTRCKPDPEGYQAARAALGLPARDCVVIEDSRPGLEAARAAGLRCAMITTSHAATELGDADLIWADLQGRDPSELPWVT